MSDGAGSSETIPFDDFVKVDIRIGTVIAVGVGEAIDDLRPFEAQPFARALMGLED